MDEQIAGDGLVRVLRQLAGRCVDADPLLAVVQPLVGDLDLLRTPRSLDLFQLRPDIVERPTARQDHQQEGAFHLKLDDPVPDREARPDALLGRALQIVPVGHDLLELAAEGVDRMLGVLFGEVGHAHVPRVAKKAGALDLAGLVVRPLLAWTHAVAAAQRSGLRDGPLRRLAQNLVLMPELVVGLVVEVGGEGDVGIEVVLEDLQNLLAA